MREVEQALAAKQAAEQEEKKRLSDHRIATKLARINGTEAPAPIKEPAPEPVAEAPTAPDVEEVPAAPKRLRLKTRNQRKRLQRKPLRKGLKNEN